MNRREIGSASARVLVERGPGAAAAGGARRKVALFLPGRYLVSTQEAPGNAASLFSFARLVKHYVSRDGYDDNLLGYLVCGDLSTAAPCFGGGSAIGQTAFTALCAANVAVALFSMSN